MTSLGLFLSFYFQIADIFIRETTPVNRGFFFSFLTVNGYNGFRYSLKCLFLDSFLAKFVVFRFYGNPTVVTFPNLLYFAFRFQGNFTMATPTGAEHQKCWLQHRETMRKCETSIIMVYAPFRNASGASGRKRQRDRLYRAEFKIIQMIFYRLYRSYRWSHLKKC